MKRKEIENILEELEEIEEEIGRHWHAKNDRLEMLIDYIEQSEFDKKARTLGDIHDIRYELDEDNNEIMVQVVTNQSCGDFPIFQLYREYEDFVLINIYTLLEECLPEVMLKYMVVELTDNDEEPLNDGIYDVLDEVDSGKKIDNSTNTFDSSCGCFKYHFDDTSANNDSYYR